MHMPMVNIGKVCVYMGCGLMTVQMHVGLRQIYAQLMVVLMMFIMNMPMRMF